MITVTLTDAQATEVLRGLRKQDWAWDQAGVSGQHIARRRVDNLEAAVAIITAGGVPPNPQGYISGVPELDERRDTLARRDADRDAAERAEAGES